MWSVYYNCMNFILELSVYELYEVYIITVYTRVHTCVCTMYYEWWRKKPGMQDQLVLNFEELLRCVTAHTEVWCSNDRLHGDRLLWGLNGVFDVHWTFPERSVNGTALYKRMRTYFGGICLLIALIGSVASYTINYGWSSCGTWYTMDAIESSFVHTNSSDAIISKGLTRLTNAVYIYLSPFRYLC